LINFYSELSHVNFIYFSNLIEYIITNLILIISLNSQLIIMKFLSINNLILKGYGHSIAMSAPDQLIRDCSIN